MPQTLTIAQQVWLDAFGLKIDAAKAAARREANRTALLDQMALEVEAHGDAIRDGLTFSLVMNNKGLLKTLKDKLGINQKLASFDPSGDPDNEIDTVHDGKNSKGLDWGSMKKAYAAIDQLVKIKQKLVDARVDEFGELTDDPKAEPLFTTQQLTKDFFTPLVRQRIVPDNIVTDTYNETSQTFNGASAAYNERLEKYTAQASDYDGLLHGLDVAGQVTEKLGQIGGDIIEAAGGPGVAKDLLSMSTVLCKGGLSLTAAVIKRDDAVGILETVGKMASSVAKTVIPEIDDIPVGDIVSTSITAAIRGPKMLKALMAGDPDAVIKELTGALTDGLSIASSATGDDQLEDIGGYIETGVTLLTGAKKFGVALAKKDKAAALEALGELIEESVNFTAEEIKKHVMPDEEGEDDDDDEGDDEGDDEKGDEPEEQTPQETKDSDLDDGDPRVAELKETIQTIRSTLAEGKSSDEERKKLKADLLEAAAGLKALIDEKRDRKEAEKQTRNMLAWGFPEAENEDEAALIDEEKRMASIDALIQKMKVDQMKFDFAKKMIGLPISVAANFFPPMDIVVAAKAMAEELMEAVAHARELLKWKRDMDDARSAFSAQASALMNRVGLERDAVIEHNIKAALECVAMIGAIVETVGGQGAPAGTAIKASARAAKAGVELAKIIYTEVEMERAWRAYKKALATPGDRKLARQAMRKNPTLAKYAMAWGALEHQDPIAKNVMKHCGLTDKTLSDPNANVDKVVTYLETMYRDDPQLVRAMRGKAKWRPGEPELSLSSWRAFVDAATAKGGLAPLRSSKLDAAFGRWEKAEKIRGHAPDDVAATKAAREGLQEIAAGVRNLAPRTQDGEVHETFQAYLEDLLDLVKDALVALPEPE